MSKKISIFIFFLLFLFGVYGSPILDRIRQRNEKERAMTVCQKDCSLSDGVEWWKSKCFSDCLSISCSHLVMKELEKGQIDERQTKFWQCFHAEQSLARSKSRWKRYEPQAPDPPWLKQKMFRFFEIAAGKQYKESEL